MSWCGPLWVGLFGTHCASQIWMSAFFPKLGKFLVTTSSNKLSAPFISFLLLGPLLNECYMLDVVLKVSFLKIIFPFFCSVWVIFFTLSSSYTFVLTFFFLFFSEYSRSLFAFCTLFCSHLNPFFLEKINTSYAVVNLQIFINR